MAQKIGRQDGLDWLIGFLKKFPLVKYRPVGDRPVSLEQWYGLEKLERTLRILKDDHDALISSPAPAPEPPKPETPSEPIYVKVAPRVAYKAGGSDARFCIYNQPGVVRDGNEWRDECGATYDENGLCKNGRRSDGPAVTSALEIDGRDYCDLPRIGEPTKNTGSWAI